MLKPFLLTFLICLFYSYSYSQSIDSLTLVLEKKSLLDTIVMQNEMDFADSIAAVNIKNEQIILSRNHYNSGLEQMDSLKYLIAIECFTNAIKIDSLFSAAYLSRGRCYEFSDKNLAISDYHSVYALDSLSLNPLYLIASLQFKSDPLISKVMYEKIISKDSSQNHALSQLGIIAFLTSNYDIANTLFTQSLDIKKDAYVFNDRASCYRKTHNLDSAISDYLSSISLNNNLAFVYNSLANVYKLKGDTENAIKYYDLAISKDFNYVLAYNNKASILIESSQFEKANINIQKSLSINPQYAPALNNLGVINHLRNKYNDAIDSFDNAILIDKNYAKAYLNRGVSKQMIRDEHGACLDWMKAKELGIASAEKYLLNDCQ